MHISSIVDTLKQGVHPYSGACHSVSLPGPCNGSASASVSIATKKVAFSKHARSFNLHRITQSSPKQLLRQAHAKLSIEELREDAVREEPAAWSPHVSTSTTLQVDCLKGGR